MKLLYVTSEAYPFCKTGGLADVAGSLPPALAAEGVETAVILPLYDKIGPQWREKMTFRRYIYVDLGWRHEYCGLFSLHDRGVTWYFVDNEKYFRRGRLYGEFDDGERFAFFSHAVVDLLPSLDWMPDILHCNDWQTALVPIYLKDAATRWWEIRHIRTVFTIHNIEYQGSYGSDSVDQLFGLDRGWYDDGTLRMDGDVNLMKGAMLMADAVTTVSPTYAAQLHDPAYAEGLESVVDAIGWKMHGVVNGIDTVTYDPASDPALSAHYTAADPAGKAVCKASLQAALGLAQEPDTPLIAMVTRLVGHKGLDLVQQAMDGIMAAGCQFVVLGTGDRGYEDFFRWKAGQYPGRLSAQILYAEGTRPGAFMPPRTCSDAPPQRALRPGADDRQPRRAPIAEHRRSGDTVRSRQVGQEGFALATSFGDYDAAIVSAVVRLPTVSAIGQASYRSIPGMTADFAKARGLPTHL